MKTFKPLFYTFFILTFTSCRDTYVPFDSPCNPDWFVQIIVKNINIEKYPITVYFKSADKCPTPPYFVNGHDTTSAGEEGWKIEDDGKYKEIKYNNVGLWFFPYAKYGKDVSGSKTITSDKELVGKERKVKIRILDKDQKTIFENQFSLRALPYKDKQSRWPNWTFYDIKKLEMVDTTYLTHLPKTGKNGNCYTIFFDLNK